MASLITPRVRRSILRAVLATDASVLQPNPWAVRAIDMAMIAFGCLAVFLVHGGQFGASMTPVLIGAAVASAVFIGLNDFGGLYSPLVLSELRGPLRKTLVNWVFTWSMLASGAFVAKAGGDLVRLTIMGAIVFGVPALVLNRVLVRAWLGLAAYRTLHAREPVGVIEYGSATSILRATRRRFKPIAWLSVEPGDEDFLERLRDFAGQLRDRDATRIVVAATADRIGDIEPLRQAFETSEFDVLLLTDGWLSDVFGRPVSVSSSIKAFELSAPPLNGAQRAVKRAMDVAFAGLALLVLSPLLVTIAIAIKLDSPGPVIFRQRRLGLDSKPFQILKFRSMRVLEDGAVVRQATQNDDRVTRVGRFIRSSSLDELPQLINILFGDMSVVGPRPHAIAHDEYYDARLPDYPKRRSVQPGLTGWAQVSGRRGETPTLNAMKERVQLDLWYIQNWSVWLDIWIILKTAFEVLRNRNVY